MSDVEQTKGVLGDFFTRIRDGVAELTAGLDDQAVAFRPAEGANSIGWLLWHLSRVQDDHIADAAGTAQVWPSWRDRFRLPFEPEATGYGQTPEEVGAVTVPADLLDGYQREVHEASLRYVDSLTAEELDRVVDTRWDPPVTVAVRLVSVLDDATKHLGQAEYVRGLAERAAAG